VGKSTIQNSMPTLRIGHQLAANRIRITAVLLAITFLVNSCSSGAVTPQPIRDPGGLVQALRQAGASIEQATRADPVVNLPGPKLYLLDGELVQIGAATLGEAGLEALVSSSPDLHVWIGTGWYLAYDGREGGVILLLSGLLGDPIQAAPTTLEEPFPPAVPRALRRLAEDLGVSPAELTVLDLQPAMWPDSCLGIITQTENCFVGEVSGWILTVLENGSQYELRSDEAGEIVRWKISSPGADG
jgi:hypothetical protein